MEPVWSKEKNATGVKGRKQANQSRLALFSEIKQQKKILHDFCELQTSWFKSLNLFSVYFSPSFELYLHKLQAVIEIPYEVGSDRFSMRNYCQKSYQWNETMGVNVWYQGYLLYFALKQIHCHILNLSVLRFWCFISSYHFFLNGNMGLKTCLVTHFDLLVRVKY